jgi:hypothetical protein
VKCRTKIPPPRRIFWLCVGCGVRQDAVDGGNTDFSADTPPGRAPCRSLCHFMVRLSRLSRRVPLGPACRQAGRGTYLAPPRWRGGQAREDPPSPRPLVVWLLRASRGLQCAITPEPDPLRFLICVHLRNPRFPFPIPRSTWALDVGRSMFDVSPVCPCSPLSALRSQVSGFIPHPFPIPRGRWTLDVRCSTFLQSVLALRSPLSGLRFHPSSFPHSPFPVPFRFSCDR